MATGAALVALAGCASVAVTPILCGIDDFDKLLKDDAPLKEWACKNWSTTVSKHVGLQTYCHHIPQDSLQALWTWNLVFWAMIWDTPS